MTLSEDGVRVVCSQPVKIYATPTDRICTCFPWHHRHHEAHTLMSLDNVMTLLGYPEMISIVCLGSFPFGGTGVTQG
jgi:hypothetical protein